MFLTIETVYAVFLKNTCLYSRGDAMVTVLTGPSTMAIVAETQQINPEIAFASYQLPWIVLLSDNPPRTTLSKNQP